MKKASISLSAHVGKIRQLAERLENGDSQPARIEIDLLLAELREMYDVVMEMTVENSTDLSATSSPSLSPLTVDADAEPVFAPEPDEVTLPSPTEPQPTVEEIEQSDNNTLFEESPESIEKPEHPECPENPEKPESPDIPENPDIPAAEPTPASQASEPMRKTTPNPQPSLFDYFKQANTEKPIGRTLADTLGDKNMQNIKSSVTSNKVNDLRTIININDKFSFMNELFHNNMKGYNDFIMKLNSIGTREEALEYVNNVATQYNWDNESMTVKTFYSIFDRKF